LKKRNKILAPLQGGGLLLGPLANLEIGLYLVVLDMKIYTTAVFSCHGHLGVEHLFLNFSSDIQSPSLTRQENKATVDL